MFAAFESYRKIQCKSQRACNFIATNWVKKREKRVWNNRTKKKLKFRRLQGVTDKTGGPAFKIFVIAVIRTVFMWTTQPMTGLIPEGSLTKSFCSVEREMVCGLDLLLRSILGSAWEISTFFCSLLACQLWVPDWLHQRPPKWRACHVFRAPLALKRYVTKTSPLWSCFSQCSALLGNFLMESTSVSHLKRGRETRAPGVDAINCPHQPTVVFVSPACSHVQICTHTLARSQPRTPGHSWLD